jgi:hypothetical protein
VELLFSFFCSAVKCTPFKKLIELFRWQKMVKTRAKRILRLVSYVRPVNHAKVHSSSFCFNRTIIIMDKLLHFKWFSLICSTLFIFNIILFLLQGGIPVFLIKIDLKLMAFLILFWLHKKSKLFDYAEMIFVIKLKITAVHKVSENLEKKTPRISKSILSQDPIMM